MPTKPVNRIGEIYGNLTVIRISNRRSAGGNAYWWCKCKCGKEREVASDSLSNKPRKKKNITECKDCAKKLVRKALYKKHSQEENLRRKEAISNRQLLKEKVPEEWLRLPLTDAHARELNKKHFFRGRVCINGHLSPYRINGGCLECSKQFQSNDYLLNEAADTRNKHATSNMNQTQRKGNACKS